MGFLWAEKKVDLDRGVPSDLFRPANRETGRVREFAEQMMQLELNLNGAKLTRRSSSVGEGK